MRRNSSRLDLDKTARPGPKPPQRHRPRLRARFSHRAEFGLLPALRAEELRSLGGRELDGRPGGPRRAPRFFSILLSSRGDPRFDRATSGTVPARPGPPGRARDLLGRQVINNPSLTTRTWLAAAPIRANKGAPRPTSVRSIPRARARNPGPLTFELLLLVRDTSGKSALEFQRREDGRPSRYGRCRAQRQG